ncbi:MAG TPA: pseudouridine synthase [Flavipsychrobacter sp.]|nr:pseudouridine synthase [Flavipsychrobacter sp.]
MMKKQSGGTSYHKNSTNKGYKKDARPKSGAPDRPFKKDEKPPRAEREFDKDDKRSFPERPRRKFEKPFEEKSDRSGRTFKKDDRNESDEARKKPFQRKSFDARSDDRPRKPFERKRTETGTENKPEKTWDRRDKFADRKLSGDSEKPERSERKPFEKNERKPFERSARKPFDAKRSEHGEDRKFEKDDRDKKYTPNKRAGTDKIEDSEKRPRKPFGRNEERTEKPFNQKPKNRDDRKGKDNNSGKFPRKNFDSSTEEQEERKPRKPSFKKELPEVEISRRSYTDSEAKPIDGAMTLNKYIAHSGESSRRDAAEMVKQGKVRVNGELILDPGYRVEPGDQITLSGKKLTPQKNLVYILLNKPKGYITTTEDPEERKTVMDLVTNTGAERLFPVGRLDRNTTGVLLLTNDGALAHRLAHPSYNMKKVYHVTLDKNLTRADYEKISKGIELEDGLTQVDAIAYLDTRHEIGLEIHSGKNRIVRRIFESLGYVVEKLDRVMYAGLTKKNVTRGKWRFLVEKEIIFLKHFKG